MRYSVNDPTCSKPSIQIMRSFLFTCWSAHQAYHDAYVCIASFHRPTEKMRHEYIQIKHLSQDLRKTLSHFLKAEGDIYFCPNPLRAKRLLKENVMATPYLHADIDDADPNSFEPRPNVLWETSPGRYQGIWSMESIIDADLAQNNSKNLAYKYGADKNGHAPNKLLRVPGSVNMKQIYEKPVVRIIRDNWNSKYSDQDLNLDLRPKAIIRDKANIINMAKENFPHVGFIWRKYRSKIYKTKVGEIGAKLMRHRTLIKPRDRSGSIYCIIAGLHSAGASREEIADVLVVSPYFISKHGENATKLWQEITRCIESWESENGR